MLCSDKTKIMDNVDSNSHVYCNTPLPETFRLVFPILLTPEGKKDPSFKIYISDQLTIKSKQRNKKPKM
jgi:hypothetical protein